MKRTVDVIVSGTALLFLSPLLAVTTLAILVSDGGPALYRAPRVGLRGRMFTMFKFRSMVPDADRRGASSTAADDPRMTKVGVWMRRYKVDELPQLWNVLIGEMSLVGPRPQVAWAVERYSEEERILLTVRPGITDPASIRFANESEILRGHPDPDRAYLELIHPEKMRLSIEYVRTRTMARDFQILLATAAAAVGLRHSNAVPESEGPRIV